MAQPLMPHATASWLVDNTALSFDQIAEFCGLHILEVNAIADDTAATKLTGRDPVRAYAIEVRGGVRGSIRAISVKLQSSAQVEGDITHQKLAIAEGAEFDGSVHLSKNRDELIPVLDPEAIERAAI